MGWIILGCILAAAYLSAFTAWRGIRRFPKSPFEQSLEDEEQAKYLAEWAAKHRPHPHRFFGIMARK